MEQKRTKNYTTLDLIRCAKRDGNKKRPYLLVNPLQGKHVPVSPKKALDLFEALTEKIRKEVKMENLLLIAFAETATGIGAAAACSLAADEGRKVYFLHTTREDVDGGAYLYFSEDHSHATDQKLVIDGISDILEEIETIVFVEDEVTTGNTISHLIDVMKEALPISKQRFVIASLLNGMDEKSWNSFEEKGIQLTCLVRSDNKKEAEKLEAYSFNGKQHEKTLAPFEFPETVQIPGYMDSRRLVDASSYGKMTRKFAQQCAATEGHTKDKRCLVLGTEEFMYPAMLFARSLEEEGAKVNFHATTRSPILPSREKGYPLKNRWELASLYDSNRKTYVYNLRAYDFVYVVTDAKGELSENFGFHSVWGALEKVINLENASIKAIQWRK